MPPELQLPTSRRARVRNRLRVAAVALLVTAAAVLALVIVRSFPTSEFISLDKGAGVQGDWTWTWCDIWIGAGGVGIEHGRQHVTGLPGSSARRLPTLNQGWQARRQFWRAAPGDGYPRLRQRSTVAGFDFYRSAGPLSSLHIIVFPLWGILAMLLLYPAVFTIGRIRRQRRMRAGKCPACGYDLRATPGRCPECGRATSAR